MASQMIEGYQFRCHFTEPQKRQDQNRSVILSNTPSQNILNWLWTDSWTGRNVIEREIKRLKVHMKPPNTMYVCEILICDNAV